MRVSFLTKDKARITLLGLIKSCESMQWAVAWATPNDLVAVALEHQGKFKKLVIGTHMYQTHPKVLEDFKFSSQLKVMPPSGNLFHPKVYLFHTDAGVSAVIGSHNLTQAAMHRNVEASMLFEGSLGDPALCELEQFIGDAWDCAPRMDAAFLYRYRQQYQAKESARKSLTVFVQSPIPFDLASPKAPFLLSWKDYVGYVSAFRFHTLAERLTVLSYARKLFAAHGSFASMGDDDRKLLSGTAGPKSSRRDGTDFAIFGAMPSGALSTVVRNAPQGLSLALDLIPHTGPVTAADYMAFVNRFERTFTDAKTERMGQLPSASRLLAMKRPDVFVCISSANKEDLCKHFGVKPGSVQLATYWEKIVVPMMQTEWWQSPAPLDSTEAAIWQGRAAMLDVMYYAPTAPKAKFSKPEDWVEERKT